MGIIQVLRRALLPQQTELKVRGGCELMPAGNDKPVLVKFAFAAFEVDKGFVEYFDKVCTGSHRFVVQRDRGPQLVAHPVGVTVAVIPREPTLLKSESMPNPGCRDPNRACRWSTDRYGTDSGRG